MDKDFMDFLGLNLSEEELLEESKQHFKRTETNPENMSYWFPFILNSNQKGKSTLKVPETKIIQLDFEMWNWLTSGDYTEEKVNNFNRFLLTKLNNFQKGNTLFMKSGIFSNKFEFHQTVVNDRNKIGEQFLNMFYASMVYGADNTSEIVFREMIVDQEGRGRIYSGMPLHTEFRVFYDFDTKEVVGVSNYWHPDIMKRGVSKEDLIIYNKESDRLLKEFQSLKSYVSEEVSLFLNDCNDLKGKWSVDIMKNGNDYWLIDMARMERSALIDKIEKVS